jgi:UDP-GlcNAc:undecaprenyl-phosphate GlcNAc-1-phosphate transferase
MDFGPYIFFFLSGLIACFLLVPFFIRMAPSLGLLDHPAHRKIHSQAVPKSGGLAVVFSILLASTISLSLFGNIMGYDEIRTIKVIFILGITLLAAFIGLMDDLFDLRPRQKFLLQALLVGVFVLLGFRFEVLHLPGLKPFGLSFLDVPLTMFWMLAILNGFNFMDGIDGLAGSVAAVMLMGIGGAAALSTGHLPGGIWLATLGVIASFLFYNWRPARIYLGDSGSMALGTFIVASLVAMGTSSPDFVDLRLFNNKSLQEPFRFQLLTVTLLVGYPAIEAALSTFRRAVKRFALGRSMESSEMDHIHHVLLKAGWSTREICLSAAAIQLVLSGAGLLVMGYQNALAIWLLLPLFIIMAYLAPRLGFFDFLHFASSRQQPHFKVANFFISMQKVKLQLAADREEVLALVSQTCQELGVKSCRLIIRPDEQGLGGTDYLHEWDLEKPAEYLGFIHDTAKGHTKGFADRYKLAGGRGGAHWVFEPQTQEEDLDVEYHVLVSDFMREALEAALKLGSKKITLEVPSVAPVAHKKISSHALRRNQRSHGDEI